ncbi:N-acetylmuramoyl-L-alanine amidase [Candidatus Avelusimicrobium gallicola]|uniref:N-acetylmuramoyl-L-alanine amidase n=1 Tax=Candidatus Avelusimicrobium gallicola TaxID=2562704 RepID=A0A1Y4DAR9_9BACT|nr:N-acetylmuramoyl-L-alanine amidase [Elusimicrobium sp. An273]OUO56317.1 hypothetical protein B5F75_06800 [Elusimicrobium sp. An273]
MKRLCKFLLSGLLCLFVSGAGHALEKVDFIVSGRDKGSVSALESNGVTYVDVQKTARKFGTGIELFAQSKQAKISTKGFYAILTAPLAEIIINAQPHTLSAPVLIQGSKMMVPAEFFLLPQFQEAVDKYVSFQDGAFYVERRFNLEFSGEQKNKTDTLLVFDARKKIAYETKQLNKHTVTVTFPNVTLKRDLHSRTRTDFIASMDVRQGRNGEAVLKVILGKNAKDWSFTETDGKLVFRAGAQKAAPVLAAAPAAQKAEAPTSQPDAKPALKGPSLANEKPSVLMEDDGFIEMKAAPAVQPVMKAEKPAASKPAPVIKAEPNPLAIRTAHKKMRIMVDPGHGGKDPGAVRGRYREKDWNLDVAKELARLLKKGGFEVQMTRDNDTFIALSERSKKANQFKADLFVSIHTNASKNRSANGFQVYFRSEKATDKEAAEVAALENEAMQYEEVHYNFVDALLQSMAKNEYINESSKLAGYVRNAVYKQPGIGIAVNQNNSVRQANFYVLKGVNSPAILVEMGYISSSKDRGRLANGTVRDRTAKGIYTGIVNYAKKEGWID